MMMLAILLALLATVMLSNAFSYNSNKYPVCKQRRSRFHHNSLSSTVSKSTVTAASSTSLLSSFITHYEEILVQTTRGVSLVDITKDVAEILKKSECQEGVVTVLSKHSTVSVTINEMEGRLVDDVRQFLLKLAPPEFPYLHNDLDFRVGPANWPGGDEAWRQFRSGEPVNAHSHLIAMVLGTSESIPVNKGQMKIGTYQNIIIVDADGGSPPKKRTIAIQIMGTK